MEILWRIMDADNDEVLFEFYKTTGEDFEPVGFWFYSAAQDTYLLMKDLKELRNILDNVLEDIEEEDTTPGSPKSIKELLGEYLKEDIE